MNMRILTVVGVLTILPLASGCGSMKQMLFGRGAACGSCLGNGPGCGPGCGCGLLPSAPPAPAMGNPLGCGAPQCGTPHGDECGCGSEFGAGFGGYDAGYGVYDGGLSMDPMNIGNPMVGSSVYPGGSFNHYSDPNSQWMNNERIVPNSQVITEGTPLAPMQNVQPLPRPQ